MSEAIVTLPPDEALILISRVFDAPRELVFKTYTKPEHLKMFWGPHGSTVPVCDVDLRPGGLWYTVMRFPNGDEFGVRSMYLEIAPPERIVYRDAPEGSAGLDGLPPPNMVTTITFKALAPKRTEVSARVQLNSIAARDMNVERGFASTVTQGLERLAELLTRLSR